MAKKIKLSPKKFNRKYIKQYNRKPFLNLSVSVYLFSNCTADCTTDSTADYTADDTTENLCIILYINIFT